MYFPLQSRGGNDLPGRSCVVGSTHHLRTGAHRRIYTQQHARNHRPSQHCWSQESPTTRVKSCLPPEPRVAYHLSQESPTTRVKSRLVAKSRYNTTTCTLPHQLPLLCLTKNLYLLRILCYMSFVA